ncbi:hypothetical protein TGAM01_v209702 [Trichoderma gamsii]|uniref:WW domain-containing protein n=1 Tax=Trichoderma gamsii TaxID=398673 RepID=A0A2P4ZAZ0_9HYPO|nr:hypothetical protein TGAM01_v209702 [Trichoderma gamsii]PON21401.1 hypothetical protein TGAM01_v209702 [Trichoderma gamsii]
MAQPSQSQHGNDDLVNDIRKWQSQQQNLQSTDYVDKVLEHIEIPRLSAGLLSLFKEAILLLREQATIPNDVRISLERSCTALILWSDGYGIAQGHLNDIFQRSSKLRHTVLKNLSRLGRVLTERLIPLAEISTAELQQLCSGVESSIEKANSIIYEESCKQGDDSSSDAGSTFSDDDLYEVAEDLRIDTYVLSSLDPLIKYPVFDFQKEDAATDDIHSAWSPQKFYIDKIIKDFPLINRSLASRLGNTNFERYLRCQANRDAIENEGGALLTEREAPEPASTIITGSKFHDSGVGTSIGPTIIHPETIRSQSRKVQSVRVPPLPKGAKDGMPFSCIACNSNVVITNNSDWKRHIYLDLQPYACLDVSCSYSSTAFESREKWISHLALDHGMEPSWDSLECPFCKHVTGSGRLAVTGHFSKHLEEISLSALPMGVHSNEASENGSEVSDADDDSENAQKRLPSKDKGKGKLTTIADNAPTSEQNTGSSTLYVYNFPNEASEEGLKAMFSKQQGYKKMLFKTTQAGPICFVEFHDTTSAIKTLLDLYGQPLPLYENLKGGVRMSFASNFQGQLSELGIGDGWSDSGSKSVPSEDLPLPPGWVVLTQEKTHRTYYYNSETNVTYWQEPLFNFPFKLSPHMPPIYQGWIPLYDHGHQQWAYVNQDTGRAQWEAPIVTPAYNPPPHMPPIPPGWIPLFDYRQQRWYYKNQETGRTQWEAPGVSQVAFKEAAERDAAEKSAQEAKDEAVPAAEARAAVISKKEEDLVTVLVPKKDNENERLGENHYALRASAAKTEEAPSAKEEERAAREEAQLLREEIQALREEARALREGIRAAREAKQTTREEEQTTQEAKEQTTSEAEKQADTLTPQKPS